jgi:hypothetical protein
MSSQSAVKGKPRHKLAGGGMIPLSVPRAEDWDRFKDRLAQLLDLDHWTELVTYYKLLKDVGTATSDEESEKRRPEVLLRMADLLIPQAAAIREKGKKQLRTLPDYADPELWVSLPRSN